MADRILTRQEMILLHLLQYIDVPVSGYVMPHAMTQQGIGLAAGMSRAHVSNCMVEMREKGLVDSVFTHPKGASSKMRAYYLLPTGIERAKEIREHLRDECIGIDDVLRRPGDSKGMSPNVARAMEELERARNAAAALGAEGDPSKARTAIEHASMAILSLSKEVA